MYIATFNRHIYNLLKRNSVELIKFTATNSTNSQLDYSVLFTEYLLNNLTRKPLMFLDPGLFQYEL